MMTTRMLIVGLLGMVGVASVCFSPHTAEARTRGWRNYSWNGGYYDPAWGQPHALLVPPNATSETAYGWGVGGTEVHRIRPQFGRPYPGSYGGGVGYQPQPLWPSHTDQFGTYYIRAPWR